MTPAPKISGPGIFDIPFDEYLADPCAEPSGNSHGLCTLLNECPAKYWVDSPLNPEWEKPETKKHFDFGHAAHDLILHGHAHFNARTHVLGEDCNLRTNDGKAERDGAMEAGKTVITYDDWQAVLGMKRALDAHEFASQAFVGGRAEQTLVHRDRETGVLLRSRLDWLPNAPLYIPDYKTARSAKPLDFQRDIANYSYHMQAAFYLDAIEAVTGDTPRSFYFVVQEKTPPYLVTCVALDDIAIGWGRIQNRKAIHEFARCLEADEWPGYAEDVVEMSLPYFAEVRLQEAHNLGRFDTSESEAA